MKSTTAISTILLASLLGCASSSDHAAIRAVSESIFDAMETRDAELAATHLIPEGAFISTAEGESGLTSFTIAEWLAELPTQQSTIRERFTAKPFILVEGDIAVLWAEYEFEVDGELSHTGIDVFNFIRTDDGWKLAGGVYSVIPAN